MIYNPFAILTVPFPFTDSSKNKRRPAVVLSSQEFQAHNGHITLLMITSTLHSPWFGDHKIINLESTGLKKDCLIRQKIFTIDMRLVIDQIGNLSAVDIVELIQNIKKHILLNTSKY